MNRRFLFPQILVGISFIVLSVSSFSEQKALQPSSGIIIPEKTETINNCPDPKKCEPTELILPKNKTAVSKNISVSIDVSVENNNREERMFVYLKFLWITNGIVKGEEYEQELTETVRYLVLEGSLESYDILMNLDYENRDMESLKIRDRNISFEELPEDYFSREGAVHIIAMGFIELKDKRMQEQMIEILEGEISTSVEKDAFRVLRESEPSDLDILKWLINELGEEYGAFLVLNNSDLSDPEIPKLIAEKLEDANPLAQEQALLLLEKSKTPDPEIHKKVGKKLNNGDYSIQILALLTLGRATNLFDPEILNSIAEQLENEEIDIQVLALLALGQHLRDSIDLKMKQKIEKKLEDENPPVVQIAALLTLGKIFPSDPEIKKKTETKLEDKNLYAIAEAVALSTFHQLLLVHPTILKSKPSLEESDEMPISMSMANDIAYFTFQEIEFSDPEVIPLIAEKLEDTNPLVEVISLLLLGEIRSFSQEIQKKIENRLEDTSPVVRRTARSVLEKISNH